MAAEDVTFLRGVFGSGEPPIPVPLAETGVMKVAIACTTTTMLVRNSGVSKICIVLLDRVKADVYRHDCHINEIYPLRLLFGCRENNQKSVYLLKLIAECTIKYAGKQYLVFENPHESVISAMMICPWDIMHLQNLMIAGANYYLKISALHGSYGGFDLKETFVSLDELLHMNNGSTVTIKCVGYKTFTMTHIMSIGGHGHMTHTMHSTKGLTDPKRLNAYMKPLAAGSEIYVFSSTFSLMSPRIHAEHLSLLSTIITPEQAAIYNGGAPDDKDVTYDNVRDDECDDDELYTS